MTSLAYRLLQCLVDGAFYSGEVLGERLGISRAAVWKCIRQLRAAGIDVVSVKGRGYCLEHGIELLNENYIRQALGSELSSRFADIVCHPELDSTNSELLAWIAKPENHGLAICLAEYQRCGRGRRGRQWHSPFASGLCLSMTWRFEGGLSSLQGLSLAVGVAVHQALEQLGLSGVELKWPNDLLVGEQKLGGILVEVGGDISGDCFAVVGVGLNGRLSPEFASAIDQPVTDLHALGWSGERNQLTVAVIASLVEMLELFSVDGFARYREAWCSRAAFIGQAVVLIQGEKRLQGALLGVSKFGELCLECDGAVLNYSGGELSLRKQC